MDGRQRTPVTMKKFFSLWGRRGPGREKPGMLDLSRRKEGRSCGKPLDRCWVTMTQVNKGKRECNEGQRASEAPAGFIRRLLAQQAGASSALTRP